MSITTFIPPGSLGPAFIHHISLNDGDIVTHYTKAKTIQRKVSDGCSYSVLNTTVLHYTLLRLFVLRETQKDTKIPQHPFLFVCLFLFTLCLNRVFKKGLLTAPDRDTSLFTLPFYGSNARPIRQRTKEKQRQIVVSFLLRSRKK